MQQQFGEHLHRPLKDLEEESDDSEIPVLVVDRADAEHVTVGRLWTAESE